MLIRKATLEDYEAIHEIVHCTVLNVYPYYYVPEVVDFFVYHHNEENIKTDILKQGVYVILEDDNIVGTGTLDGRYIGRVYVHPEHHGRGYGKAIMDELEAVIAKNHTTSFLDASLPSYDFYLRRGYQPTEYHKYKVENERIMCYYVMEKNLEQPIQVPVIIRDNY